MARAGRCGDASWPAAAQSVSVLKSDPAQRKLEAALADASGVYVTPGTEMEAYFEQLREDIRRHQCAPYEIHATVVPPGFPDIAEGETVSGYCVAKRGGYWLVYSSQRDTFFAFWGADEQNLGAHGVYGSPLYCWSA